MLHNNKRYGYAFILLLLVFFFLLILIPPDNGVAPEFNWQFKKDSNFLSMVFVGDIMLSRVIGDKMEHKNNWIFPFLLLDSRIQGADIAFANLENPVSLRGKDFGSIYSFRADPKSISGLSFAGFDIVSIANNHIFDWGDDAFLDTLIHLKNADIAYVGAGINKDAAHEPKIIHKKGMKVAFLAYSQFASSGKDFANYQVAPMDITLMTRDVLRARETFDVVVVSIHWGEEYNTKASSYQKDIAHKLVDSGASLIIGHHPHVVQEVEEYKDGVIAYSLGNFVFDQNFSEETGTGLMLEVNFLNGQIQNYKTTEIKFNEEYQPFIP